MLIKYRYKKIQDNLLMWFQGQIHVSNMNYLDCKQYMTVLVILVYIWPCTKNKWRKQLLQKDWATFLINLVPLHVINIIRRENESKIHDYDYIKGILLKLYKLSLKGIRQTIFPLKRSHRLIDAISHTRSRYMCYMCLFNFTS